MSQQPDANTHSAYEFGMVRFQKDPSKVAEKGAAPARSAVASPEDLLFGGSEAGTELETPIAGDAEPLKAVSECWETASQWSQGAEDVIAETMAAGPHPPAKNAEPAPAHAARAKSGTHASVGSSGKVATAKPTPAASQSMQPVAGGALSRRPRRRPTSSSYVVAGTVLACGVGCGAWLWLSIGAWPLACVTAVAGAIGAGFSFVLTAR